MLKYFKKENGFTLIELLVVIAIIAVLASIVLVSLNTARSKGRDARRIADIKSLQLALALTYDKNLVYPIPTGAAVADVTQQNAGHTALLTLVPEFIPAVPLDPDGTKYFYGTNTAGDKYYLAAVFENKGQGGALAADTDTTAAANLGFLVEGQKLGCGSGAAASGASEVCYDVTP